MKRRVRALATVSNWLAVEGDERCTKPSGRFEQSGIIVLGFDLDTWRRGNRSHDIWLENCRRKRMGI